jgi:hypothetical protein
MGKHTLNKIPTVPPRLKLSYRGVVILITLHTTPLILYFYTSLFLWLRQQKENLLCSSEHIGMLAALLCCQNKKEGVIKIGIRRYRQRGDNKSFVVALGTPPRRYLQHLEN